MNAYQMTRVNARDMRIDFFRGIALLMILVDHVRGDPISRFTYQNLGFSDAAEIFVFLSGTSCGIVYSRVLARGGWIGFSKAITKRAALIYAYYLWSSIATILLISTAADSIKNAGVIDDSFLVMREDIISRILSTILLRSPPELPGLLVLYLLLTLIIMPLFLIGDRHILDAERAAVGRLQLLDQTAERSIETASASSPTEQGARRSRPRIRTRLGAARACIVCATSRAVAASSSPVWLCP